MISSLDIQFVEIDNNDLKSLINKLDNDLLKRYPESSIHGLDLISKEKEKIFFVIAYYKNKPVGCGAIRHINNNVCELKRFFVIGDMREQGIGKAIYMKLEKESVIKGYKNIVLETGYKQPESIGLYKKMGFYEIPKFGDYINDPHSVCFKKNLE